MNPIAILRRELASAEHELTALTDRYTWLKGWGTGWKAAHYGMSDAEYNAVYERCVTLRQRVAALDKEITRLQKVARPGRGVSLLAHRGL